MDGSHQHEDDLSAPPGFELMYNAQMQDADPMGSRDMTSKCADPTGSQGYRSSWLPHL